MIQGEAEDQRRERPGPEDLCLTLSVTDIPNTLTAGTILLDTRGSMRPERGGSVSAPPERGGWIGCPSHIDEKAATTGGVVDDKMC